ncbi:hypothetical protein [Burkholderia pseudomallei]|uniref:hypothetical protein n=1 Tax=Burkholderia pseudomallei TaxID=28450 RepID=UPI0012AED19E|nr:hypothetical protein [Burkholderia pseudomallei]
MPLHYRDMTKNNYCACRTDEREDSLTSTELAAAVNVPIVPLSRSQTKYQMQLINITNRPPTRERDRGNAAIAAGERMTRADEDPLMPCDDDG